MARPSQGRSEAQAGDGRQEGGAAGAEAWSHRLEGRLPAVLVEQARQGVEESPGCTRKWAHPLGANRVAQMMGTGGGRAGTGDRAVTRP